MKQELFICQPHFLNKQNTWRKFGPLLKTSIVTILFSFLFSERREHRREHSFNRNRGRDDDAHDVRSPLHVGHLQRVLVPVHRARILQTWRVCFKSTLNVNL